MNHKIDNKVSSLSSDHESLETYKAYIDSLFKITEVMIGSNIGIPQGPAYARHLAELYLAGLDEKLDNKLKDGSLYLYQRYVDDIFFIAPTEWIVTSTWMRL